ncbi:sulfotransferase family protein [Nocardiopsis tropica]|uniref:Sulfotransferase family protein n=1 Tax=Nocardiopsis tropica TaxID=109330 RepID=A0ABV1ZS96_9ACTN|nr:sulfotransferase [Nocardiopsis tropica]
MHVIGAGLPRTGTTSMKAALEQLGLGPCHHMFEVLASPDLARRWAGTVPPVPGGIDWGHVLEGWPSGVDWPLSFFWRELAEAYPDAKFVLTVRDPHRWYTSMLTTIFELTRKACAEDADARVPVEFRRIRPLLDHMWQASFGVPCGAVPSEEVAVAAFERHAEQVRAELPADRLLVYRAGEGWERLCAFLGTEVPDGPFPHLNDTEAMLRQHETWFGGATAL